ncbi:MAG: biotin--[acetyl-CoA-carboxylase] ligase [Proteobacteria bacterium]|nr:biotin--[acetyl-CoA-carboxylase] ligase [Pseudomonadota bacterium]MBU2226851.1 biotin--[acetyl-CoA-carboxylase] ligase [Pseudomonadota bacterium]MBU2261729.1 biotin--[acetyl-CoA-carboxylase] ligase [Pseudomonadota bacterium]
MNIGVNPPELLSTFFPGEDPCPGTVPGEEETTLWSAAGHGEARWFALPDDPNWGRWSALVFADEVPFSQYDRLQEFLRQGRRLPDRAACIALTGRNFHGQRNRPWAARRGNLHLTVHFAPWRPATEIGLGFTLLPAVACIRAIRSLSGGAVAAGIKWVNDIVAGEKKVGGFLAATQTQGGIVQDVVLGLGINIDVAPDVEPTPFVPAVGCLREIYPSFRLAKLLPNLLRELNGLYELLLTDGFLPLVEAYREYAVIVGRSVRIWQDAADSSAEELRTIPPLRRGVVTAIGDDLSLILADSQAPVIRGRLAYEEDCRRYGL